MGVRGAFLHQFLLKQVRLIQLPGVGGGGGGGGREQRKYMKETHTTPPPPSKEKKERKDRKGAGVVLCVSIPIPVKAG